MNNDQKPTISLAQWCAYLPYGLEIKHHKFERPAKLTAAKLENIIDSLEFAEKFKPLLRPIDYNVNKILAAAYEYQQDGVFWNIVNKRPVKVLELDYTTIQVLFAHHYDVFGLIEKGLALPIE
jgi:hypothetical protein